MSSLSLGLMAYIGRPYLERVPPPTPPDPGNGGNGSADPPLGETLPAPPEGPEQHPHPVRRAGPPRPRRPN
jgi:hypothetical protein